jgi:hypothetical protein
MAWANTMEEVDGEMVPADFSADDFPDNVLATMRADARDFFDSVESTDDATVASEWRIYRATLSAETAGFDFALSRNGHGAGFFDREHGFPALQRFAMVWGESTVMLFDDGTADIG